MLSITSRNGDKSELFRALAEKISGTIRVAVPGIIQSFDPATQTCTVQPAIREKVRNDDGTTTDTDLPLLLDLPVVLPRTTKFALTFPVEAGDECLVIFADSCINAWFSSGGIQNQEERRRHDLSDGFAIVGVGSLAASVGDYLEDGVQLRSLEEETAVTLKQKEITLSTPNASVHLTEDTASLTAEGGAFSLSPDHLSLTFSGASIQMGENTIDLSAQTIRANGTVIP